ncbi:MAG: lipid-A-disaccharide synthase [Lysobacteraceae bacterium]|nr:MAG: lipid-A-disaccharide synthase [Xanthomonadaceae bacterium]
MRFFIVAGEASGDQLGSKLIDELRSRYPNAQFSGIAGPQMVAAGCHKWEDYEQLSIMGLVEVLRHLPRLLLLRRRLVRHLHDSPPDCFIGIDAPDFNLTVERRAKALGIKTVHYVSPSVWAWRRKRVARMRQGTDLVLTLFPFEPAIYDEFDVKASFVGHPFADQIPMDLDRAHARSQLQLKGQSVLAVLPGSRLGEIQRLAEPFAQACQLLNQQIGQLKVLIPCVNSKAAELIGQAFATHAPDVDTDLLDGQARTALSAADATLIASGTATLEALLCQCPMVVAYRIAPLTHFIVRTLGMLKTDVYSLPNILADKPIVPELMQHQTKPESLAYAVAKLLQSKAQQEQQLDAFGRIHQTLRQQASARAADAVSKLLIQT